jgi:DNA polymerase (family 10)
MSSDGVDSIEDMAEAARERGYGYIGITDHSQSLKIAGGVSVEDLWGQIRFIDKLNGKLRGFQILKSSEVDILADGSLDYPDELLKELDYTVCSIHSRFALGQDDWGFHMVACTGSFLLCPREAVQNPTLLQAGAARLVDTLFEINSSPDRLPLGRQRSPGGEIVENCGRRFGRWIRHLRS